MNKFSLALTAAAPTYGPSVLVIFGLHVPIASLVLSLCGLLLARIIAPKPVRKLTRKQEMALTALLVIVLFVAVAGEIPLLSPEPLGVGMAVVWGLGLGTSGLLAIEFFSKRFMNMLKALWGEDANRFP